MWKDENGVTHSVWVPPEEILGEDAVAALRAVPREIADAALTEVHAAAMEIRDQAEAGAMTGPSDLEDVALEQLPYPPVFAGLAAVPGESLGTTVLRFLAGVPATWRVEALEAVYEALEPAGPPPIAPEEILGAETVAALRAVPREIADPALDELNARAMAMLEAEESTTGSAAGSDVPEQEAPPVLTGLVPREGEPLTTTVLEFVDELPTQWRVRALQAVCDALGPDIEAG